ADSCLTHKMTRAGYQLTAADRSPDEAVVRYDPSHNQDHSHRSGRRTPDSECDCPQLPWVSGADDHGQGLAVATGLAGDPPRVAPQGRDTATDLGGISRRASRRLRPQLVLRTLSSLGRPVVADDAAGACGRREAVRRLRRYDD